MIISISIDMVKLNRDMPCRSSSAPTTFFTLCFLKTSSNQTPFKLINIVYRMISFKDLI